jgi:hypothetical protein
MLTVIRAIVIAGLLVVSLSAVTQADEAAERRAKALNPGFKDDLTHAIRDEKEVEHWGQALMEAAAELRQNGRLQEAEELEAAVMARRAAREARSAEADAHARVAQKLNERLLDLLTVERELSQEPGADAKRAEIREQLESVQRQLEEMSRPNGRDLPPELSHQIRRIELAERHLQHLRVAAENLKAAEMHDMANEVMEKVGPLEKGINARKKELAQAIRNHHRVESGHPPEHGANEEMNHLRLEVEVLRRELKEAHQALDKLRERAEAEESLFQKE